MTTVRFRDSQNVVLFDYPKAEALSGDADRVVFLSQRDFYLLLNSIEFIGEFRNRVFTSHIRETYEICSDAEWATFQGWVEDLENNLGGWPVSNEYLERIAIALEEANNQAEHQVINLSDLAEVLGIDPSEDTEDLLEAFEYLSQLFPGLPQLSLPTVAIPGFIGQMRTNGAYLQLLRDISISQRAIATAQGGVDFAGLYDTMGETADSLIVKAGWQGKAYWLWRWLSNDQIPGWTAWITTISGLLLGSIRGATYDVAEAIEEMDSNQQDLIPVLDAIENVLGGDFTPEEE